MSPGPSRSDVNASLLPSGDQLGWLFIDPAFAERFTSSAPKRLLAWISIRLLRCDSKAIPSATIGDEVARGVPLSRAGPLPPHAPAAPNASTVARPKNAGFKYLLRANAVEKFAM